MIFIAKILLLSVYVLVKASFTHGQFISQPEVKSRNRLDFLIFFAFMILYMARQRFSKDIMGVCLRVCESPEIWWESWLARDIAGGSILFHASSFRFGFFCTGALKRVGLTIIFVGSSSWNTRLYSKTFGANICYINQPIFHSEVTLDSLILKFVMLSSQIVLSISSAIFLKRSLNSV